MTFNEVIGKYEAELARLQEHMRIAIKENDGRKQNIYFGMITLTKSFLDDLENLKWQYT